MTEYNGIKITERYVYWNKDNGPEIYDTTLDIFYPLIYLSQGNYMIFNHFIGGTSLKLMYNEDGMIDLSTLYQEVKRWERV